MIKRAKEIYEPFGEWIESKKEFRFTNGAFITFRYLDRDDDASNYQGFDFTDIIFEELSNFPSPVPVMKIKATLRSGKGIPCAMMATANPGGPGMSWVRTRYIDPDPNGWKPITERFKFPNPNTGEIVEVSSTRIFIPSRVWDNKILLKNDPMYIARLAETGSEQLVNAWLNGDWYSVEGAFFDKFDPRKHVIDSFEIPQWWTRGRCGDWGSAKPFAFYWFAVAGEKHVMSNGAVIPKGAMVFYREWYGCYVKPDGTFTPNVGLKLHAEEVGRMLYTLESKDPIINYGVLDPSAFAEDGGPSIEARIYLGMKQQCGDAVTPRRFRRADNKRVPGSGPMGGWDQMRSRLEGADGRPMMYFFKNCIHAIRTIPMQQHDPDNVENMDTDGEDHCCDAIRYGCMSRPYVRPRPDAAAPLKTVHNVTLNEMWDAQPDRRADGRI